MDTDKRLAALGIGTPEILLPRGGIDLEGWAVIACDQFTQDRGYWARAAARAGEGPSTLALIFPEVYLEDGGRGERIRNIHRAMGEYLEGVFAPPRRGWVYVERSVPGRPARRGLVLTVDLECYDWDPKARPLIRATEGTVRERIGPRTEIRRGAPLECPHVLVLIDDREDRLLPALGERARQMPAAYRTPLMMNSGEVSGWFLDREEDRAFFAGGLEVLAGQSRSRYGREEPFLFAVGDGNHSLAAARAVWEDYKRAHAGEEGLEDHPSRWALVEVENLYDPGIAFEPIHRLVLGASAVGVLDLLAALPGFTSRPVRNGGELAQLVRLSPVAGPDNPEKNRLGLAGEGAFFLVETSAPGLITDALQGLLDGFTGGETGRSLDYLHGEAELFRAVSGSALPSAGLLLPPVRKEGLFRTVAQRGPLPRKSFSMGEAREKRFYLECRKLFG